MFTGGVGIDKDVMQLNVGIVLWLQVIRAATRATEVFSDLNRCTFGFKLRFYAVDRVVKTL